MGVKFEEFIKSKIHNDTWGAIALDYYPTWSLSYPGTETEKRNQYPVWIVDNYFKPNMDIVDFHKILLGVCIQLLRNDCDAIFKCSLHLLVSSNSKEIEKGVSEFANHYKTYNMQNRFLQMFEKGIKMNKDEYLVDIAIVVAVKDELLAIKKQFDSWTRIDDDRSVYTFHKSETENGITIIVAESGMGPKDAINLTKDIIELFSPSIIFLVGIAGGIGETIKLGDVVIANLIVDYENAKIKGENTVFRWYAYNTDTFISNRIKNFPDEEWINNISSPPPSGLQNPTITKHLGIVMSGNKVISSKEYAENLLSVWDLALAVEMESVGVANAINQSVHKPRFAVIKSISDYADPSKNDDWRGYCCDVAATLTMSYINSLEKSTITNLQIKKNDQTPPSIKQSDISNITVLEYQEIEKLQHKYEISDEELKKKMNKKFDISELKELIFSTELDWENIGGSRKIEKIMYIIDYFNRHDQLPFFLSLIENERPDFFNS
jgi:nucleoside phosphorylase